MSIESTIFFSNRIFVYDLRNAKNPEKGYRAADYSSTQHMWAGMLKLNSGQDANGVDTHTLQLEHDPNDAAGKSGVFAQCVIKPGVVAEALDSSRYFAVRFDNEQTGQFIMLLIGFAQKNDAFDFRHEMASLSQRSKEVLPQDTTDYTLKQATITLDVNALRGKAPAPKTTTTPSLNVEKVSLNAPSAPVRGRRTNQATASVPTTSQQQHQQQQPTQNQNFQIPQNSQPFQQPQQKQTPIDIFATLSTPQQQAQPQPQQPTKPQNNSSSDPFDIFATANTSAVVTKQAPAPSAAPAAKSTQKSTDPFDFVDFDF